MIQSDTQLGLTNRFKVEVDGVDLGRWSGCQGLAVQYHPYMLEGTGGDYDFVHILPGQVKYTPIKLSRAMSAQDSKALFGWIKKKIDEVVDMAGSAAYSDGSAKIMLVDAHGDEIMTWQLRGVHPSSWTGPNLDAGSTKVAIEVLELVHEGFI
jgi:phage tail-like protein